jgi:hypothetical protein
MPVNELLEEKWETQRKMAEKAGHDVKKLLDNAEETVEEMVKELGLKLKYANRTPSFDNTQKAS